MRKSTERKILQMVGKRFDLIECDMFMDIEPLMVKESLRELKNYIDIRLEKCGLLGEREVLNPIGMVVYGRKEYNVKKEIDKINEKLDALMNFLEFEFKQVPAEPEKLIVEEK
jgi:hypothetical protein